MGEEKPLIGITMGDPAGIGPEVIVKTLSLKEIYEVSRPLVIGDAEIIRRALRFTKLTNLKINAINDISEAEFRYGVIDVLDLKNVDAEKVSIGKLSAEAGKAAVEYVLKATDLALKGIIDAIVTAPINKEAINMAGYHYQGHTELLKELTGAENVVMMLAAKKLKVTHVTTHVSLREACKLITKDRVLRTIEITHDELVKYFAIPHPRIAVAALNPHGGEGGLFGREEIEEISPAVEMAREKGIDAYGPLPADTVFYRALRGDFDVVVAM